MFTGMSQLVICEITVSGSVMEENSTSVKMPRYSRAATAPELWIPYIMIGVSCMTFLAVHFYCYHKRNRERYLRKRDEKRVKCGLLERRRITTLMVARYQYSLGIGRKEPHDDNTVSWNNGNEYLNASKGNNHDHLFGDEYIPGSPHLFSPAIQQWDIGGSSFSSETGTSRLTSSQSWPLVSERSPLPSNAHCKTVTEKQPQITTPTLKVSLDSSAAPSVINEAADRLAIGRSPYRYGYSGTHRRNYLTSMLKPPPTTYSNAYYTNIPSGSHFTSPSPLFFKLKPNKRRYDGVPVDELSEVYKPHEHHVTHDRGEVSSPFYDDDGDVSEPYIMADPNDDGFGYGSRGHNHYHPTVLDASGFAVSEEEAYPFSDFREDYDGINANPYMVRGGASAIRGVDRFQGDVDCFLREPVMSAHNTLFNKKNICQGNHTQGSPLVQHQAKTSSGKPAKVANHGFNPLFSDWTSGSPSHRALKHTKSKSKAHQLYATCETNSFAHNGGQLAGGGQVSTDIGRALIEPGRLLLKPYMNSRPSYNNNCVRSEREVNLQMESPNTPSVTSNNQLPCGTTPFPKNDDEAISHSPTMPINLNGQRLQKSSGHDLSPPVITTRHSLNSPQNTSSTPDRTPNSPQTNTPSTPGSCTSPSSPRTPTLRTLNPNLVFPHSKRKTTPTKPE